jgi:hypothetical protein
VKLTRRLLLTLPFGAVTFFYLKFQLADNGCAVLIELVYTFILWTLLALSFALALFAVLGKRQSQKRSAEPYSLTITIIALSSIVISLLLGDTLKDSIWIKATSQKNNSSQPTHDLTLRKNGTFEGRLNSVDFSCFANGQYQIKTDTLILEDTVVKMTQFKLASKYIISDKTLVPLLDTVKDTLQPLKFDIVGER